MAAVTYMLRRGGTYWFRKRLPQALAGREAPLHVRAAFPLLVNPKTGLFKIEVTASLGTKDPRTAKRLDLRRASEIAEMFEAALRLHESGPTQAVPSELPPLADIEAEHLRELLELDDRERASGDAKIGLQTEEDREAIRRAAPFRSAHPDTGLSEMGPAHSMSEAHAFAYELQLQNDREVYESALGRGDFSRAEPAAQVFFHRRGERYDPEDATHRDVALALLRAAADATEIMLERLKGKRIPTPEARPVAQGSKFSAAFDNWKRGSAARGGRQVAPNTLREAELAVRLFTEWATDKPLSAITKEDSRGFRNALERRPSKLPRPLRALPLRELLARDLRGYPPAHGNTVNKMLNILSAIVQRAEREGLTDDVPNFANPFRNVRSDVDDRLEESREPFSTADLKAIFETPVFIEGVRPLGGGREAAFWLPILALLTGARQEELAQLRVSDLAQDPETGVWHLDIGATGGRTVKTASSRRKVPLHPALESIGLLRYREVRARNVPEDAPLWPDIKSDVRGKRSAAWSKWFGRYLRETAGVTDRRKVFHSFRHTFKRMARDANLTEELSDALTGHAGGGSVGRSYGRGFGLKTLSDGVAKIEAPASVSALRWGPVPTHGGKHEDAAAEGTPSSDV